MHLQELLRAPYQHPLMFQLPLVQNAYYLLYQNILIFFHYALYVGLNHMFHDLLYPLILTNQNQICIQHQSMLTNNELAHLYHEHEDADYHY